MAIFKKALTVSLLGHFALFNLFNFTFGDRSLPNNYVEVNFLGSILNHIDTTKVNSFLNLSPLKFKADMPTELFRQNWHDIQFLDPHLKPPVSLSTISPKVFPPCETTPLTLEVKKTPSVILHPLLPHHFLIYFRDRQRVHIEVMFNLLWGPKRNTILICRKISSGNLEADLLSMRYISHYLYVQQQAMLKPNKWQTVKIDLSADND